MKQKNKFNRRKYIQFTSIPFEMFIIIFGGFKLGAWLDEKYPNDIALYTLIFSLIGVFTSMGYIVWRVRKLTK